MWSFAANPMLTVSGGPVLPPKPPCQCQHNGEPASRPHEHSAYCAFYRAYGQALGSVSFEPGDPGYDEASALKRKVG